MNPFINRAVALGALLVWSSGCSQPEPANVVVVTWDTTRADYLDLGTAPYLMALAKEGVSFSNARTTVPLTTPAHASLLTGHYPQDHGVRVNGFHRLRPSTATLAEAFAAKGYSTGAFVSAAVLGQDYGLGRGFDRYDDAMETSPSGGHFPERSAESTLAAASRWVEEQGAQPFFVWVHLFEPHRPWEPSSDALRIHSDPYRAEIWDTDRLTHDFLKRLDRLGALSSSVVVVTSDHGEGLGEHGEWTHGSLIYDSTMRIPLVFWAGKATGIGLAAGSTVTGPVSLVDVAPTLADWFELDLEGMSGRSLVKASEGGEAPGDRDLLMESGEPAYLYNASPLFGWARESMVWIDSPQPERFDVQQDPGQLTNLFRDDTDRAGLESGRSMHPRAEDSILPSRQLNAKEISQLEALGYVSTPIQNLPTEDIKSRIPLMAMAQSGGAGYDLEEMLDQLDQWESDWGPLQGIQQLRVMVLDTQGNVEEADAYLESVGAEALLRDRLQERSGAAVLVRAIEAALENDPFHPTAHADLALTLWRIGRVQEAVPHFEKALIREPENPQVHLDAVRFFVGQQDPERALDVLTQFATNTGGLSGEWICQKARLLGLLKREAEQVALLRECQESGGELGPPELELLRKESVNGPHTAP